MPTPAFPATDTAKVIVSGDTEPIIAVFTAAPGDTVTIGAGGLFTLEDSSGVPVSGLSGVAVTGAQLSPMVAPQAYYSLDSTGLPFGDYVAVIKCQITATRDGLVRHRSARRPVRIVPAAPLIGGELFTAPKLFHPLRARLVNDRDALRLCGADVGVTIAAVLSDTPPWGEVSDLNLLTQPAVNGVVFKLYSDDGAESVILTGIATSGVNNVAGYKLTSGNIAALVSDTWYVGRFLVTFASGDIALFKEFGVYFGSPAT